MSSGYTAKNDLSNQALPAIYTGVTGMQITKDFRISAGDSTAIKIMVVATGTDNATVYVESSPDGENWEAHETLVLTDGANVLAMATGVGNASTMPLWPVARLLLDGTAEITAISITSRP